MSELKLCPMSFSFIQEDQSPIRSLCLKEQCAWWVAERRKVCAEYPIMRKVEWNVIPGHCVVLDWGKKC